MCLSTIDRIVPRSKGVGKKLMMQWEDRPGLLFGTSFGVKTVPGKWMEAEDRSRGANLLPYPAGFHIFVDLTEQQIADLREWWPNPYVLVDVEYEGAHTKGTETCWIATTTRSNLAGPPVPVVVAQRMRVLRKSL